MIPSNGISLSGERAEKLATAAKHYLDTTREMIKGVKPDADKLAVNANLLPNALINLINTTILMNGGVDPKDTGECVGSTIIQIYRQFAERFGDDCAKAFLTALLPYVTKLAVFENQFPNDIPEKKN